MMMNLNPGATWIRDSRHSIGTVASMAAAEQGAVEVHRGGDREAGRGTPHDDDARLINQDSHVEGEMQ
eukprot:3736849-Rhodomonas_salina.1